MQKHLIASAVALAMLGTAGAAAAQQKPEDAIKYRQSALFIVGQNFAPIAAMAQGKMPYDQDLAAQRAAIVAYVLKLPWPAFSPGTDKGNTKAKPEIWSNLDDFQKKAEAAQAEAMKLADVAKTGHFEALKAQVGATGKACKACHDEYRNK